MPDPTLKELHRRFYRCLRLAFPLATVGRQSWPEVQSLRDGLTVDAQTFDPVTNVAAKLLPDLSRQQNDATFVQSALLLACLITIGSESAMYK
jgi:hypothetical protein